MCIRDRDQVIRQGKELGIFFYMYTGGEPLVRKADLIRLCEAHPDCAFMAFTNAVSYTHLERSEAREEAGLMGRWPNL